MGVAKLWTATCARVGLDPSDFQVVETATEAIDLLSRGDIHPTWIVTDYHLPGASGLDLLKWLRANEPWKSVPVTLFSGAIRPETVAEAQALGVTETLYKPMDFADFPSKIRRWWSSLPPRKQ